MSYRWHIDRFSSLDDLSKRDQRDPDVVLHRLRLAGKVSCFEMSDCPTLRNTIQTLEKIGKIRMTKMGYPWHGFEVVEPAK